MLISVSPNQTQSVTFPPQNSIVSPCWSLMATDIYIGLHNTGAASGAELTLSNIPRAPGFEG